jgi:hypothetical protein
VRYAFAAVVSLIEPARIVEFHSRTVAAVIRPTTMSSNVGLM